MNEMLKLRFTGGRDAPARARQALKGLNGSLSTLYEPVRLLVTELVTNSVRHAGAGPESFIELDLTTSSDKIRVEVGDPGPGFDQPLARQEPGGFGLLLVERLADRWGVVRDRGARVWFEIDRRSDASLAA
jgi:anti-sigma regulatory factor (Ser/Thr protein kinase)